ncbi:SDR family NAD(P)-dependent oxidoreductase [Natrinema caseinilyticum]|uniref:SDR family NAD(P)-dependent oxidoreductase n=1 Tax=Natrinema caseinilyticum TaxID=2961570 RepID=UPI0020C383C3|nr:SDR family NAD(P)-dependent oxidoreductase [Natrinema caseinilyticum]
MIDGKVAIITGGASGLGRETAFRMAELGASVVVSDLGSKPHGEGADEEPLHDVVDEITANGGEAMASFGDITDYEYVESLVEETVEEYGRIDGAVNYAGFLRDDMLFNMDPENWKAVTDVHLTGHFNLIHHLGGYWRQRSKAEGLDSQRSFVSVSSASSRGSASQINYSAAKAGILGLTRTAARELHRYNVRVNAMMPAAITRMLDANVPEDVLEQLPQDELGPEKVVALPIVLLADDATDVNGWTFAIGGDTVFTVTDPEWDRSLTAEGGWNATDLAAQFDDLLEGEPRSKTEPGGLLNELVE